MLHMQFAFLNDRVLEYCTQLNITALVHWCWKVLDMLWLIWKLLVTRNY